MTEWVICGEYTIPIQHGNEREAFVEKKMSKGKLSHYIRLALSEEEFVGRARSDVKR